MAIRVNGLPASGIRMLKSAGGRRPRTLRTAEQAVEPQSYWWFFIGSIDRKRDIHIIQQALFWAEINHPHDSIVNVEIPNLGDRDEYYFFLKQFGVEDTPCLILGDNPTSPDSFIKFSPGFFTERLLGPTYEKTRDVLDRYHNIMVLHGNLASVKKRVLQSKVVSAIGVAWRELKDLVSFSISAAA